MDESYEVKLPPNTVIGGRYTIVRHLASGGMAQVYVAIQAPLGRKVAVKVLHRDQAFDPHIVKRFHREAVAVSKLTHPNTITVHDFGTTDDGKFYLVMEFLEGESLAERLRREQTLGIDEAVEITVQVAKSLAEAHAKGIVHRDLKPDNIFLGDVEHNLVKVLDFGIAHVHHGDTVTKLTQAGTIPGTPEYMSPEQAQGNPVDQRSDLYALGVVLYEMLTGAVPFTGTTPLAIILKHISEAPPRLPNDFPRPLIDFVRRLMAKDPQRRPADAYEFIEDLQHAVSGSSLPRSPGDGRSRGPSSASRRGMGGANRGGGGVSSSGGGPDRRRPMSPAEMHKARTQIMTTADRSTRPPMRSARAEPSAEQREHAPTVLDNVLPDIAQATESTIERAAPEAALEPRRGPKITLPGGQRGVVDKADAQASAPGSTQGASRPDVLETFLAFAEPTIKVLGPNPDPNALQQNLTFAQMAWNAAREGGATLDGARAYLAQSGSPRMIEVFDMLVQRKLVSFDDHDWRIHKLVVEPRPGGGGAAVKLQIVR